MLTLWQLEDFEKVIPSQDPDRLSVHESLPAGVKDLTEEKVGLTRRFCSKSDAVWTIRGDFHLPRSRRGVRG